MEKSRSIPPAPAPEEPDVAFLRRLLGTLAMRSGGQAWFQEAWDLAMGLYGETAAPQIRGPEGEGGPGRPTVLVAYEDPTTGLMLHRLLAREFRVLQAEDGARAVPLAREAVPDLILLGAVLPAMDGFTAFEHLRQHPLTREIPVLFLASLQGDEEELRALEAGAADFLRRPFNPGHILARVRNHLGLKLSRDRLREQAGRDGLTELANRRRFDQTLEQEWQRCRREGKPLSLILGDVDSFKNFNDAYGHPAGDACLKAVARAFREVLRRPADLAARYGGEEFVCLLPDTDEGGAQSTADRITEALAALAMPHAHSAAGPWVTVSLGSATAFPVAGGSPDGLLEEADRCMYRAKRRAKARGHAAGANRA